MSYNNFLEESGLFKLIFKIPDSEQNKNGFKSNSTSINLLKKIDFSKSYPENI